MADESKTFDVKFRTTAEGDGAQLHHQVVRHFADFAPFEIIGIIGRRSSEEQDCDNGGGAASYHDGLTW